MARSRIDPFTCTVAVVFELPHRHSLLYFLDDIADGLQCRAAVRMCGGDSDAYIPEVERANPVLDNDRGHSEELFNLDEDARQLSFRHCRIGGVIDAIHGTTVVLVADRPEKYGHCATLWRGDFRDQGRGIDRAFNDRGAAHPPATGGISAISSPTETGVCSLANVRFTATRGVRGNSEAEGRLRRLPRRSATRSPGFTGTSIEWLPTSSA